MSEYNLNGKVAVITGASKGLGKAMALALGAAGAGIALASRDVEQLNGVKEAVENAGGKAQVFQADVSEEEQIRKLEHDVMGAFNGVHIRVRFSLCSSRSVRILDSRSTVFPSTRELADRGAGAGVELRGLERRPRR